MNAASDTPDEIQTPFPVEATVTPREGGGYSATLPCPDEWMEHTEHGDYVQQAADSAARKHGNQTTVSVRFNSDDGETCSSFEIIGPVDEEAQ
jgi:hypothetical protein